VHACHQLLDRPRECQTHASGTLAKADEVFFGSQDVEMIIVPICHHAIEHICPEVERNARY
jgi:hypothetical protein